MQLMIAGPPGAGKGTQSALLCRHYDLLHLSTGEVLREAVREGSELGKQADSIMRAGDLLPDALMLDLVLDWIAQHPGRGFLLDGFPRTLEQAEGLEKNGVHLDAVLHISLPDEVIVSRLSGRRVHLPSGRIYHLAHHQPKVEGHDDETGEPLVQRDDDRPEAVQRRLDNYRRQTEPVLEYYRTRDDIPCLIVVGEGQVQEVFGRICQSIDASVPRRSGEG